jgi:hypothetical protein
MNSSRLSTDNPTNWAPVKKSFEITRPSSDYGSQNDHAIGTSKFTEKGKDTIVEDGNSKTNELETKNTSDTDVDVEHIERIKSGKKVKGTRLEKAKRHWKRFWKWYVIGLIVFLAIFLPLL